MSGDPFGGSAAVYDGAKSGRMLGDWNAWLTHPDNDWAQSSITLADRAWDLVRNDPLACAIVKAELLATHGSEGLRYHSLYREADRTQTTDAERAVRLQLDTISDVTWEERGFDASGMLCRYELEKSADMVARVSGDCALIRCWKPQRQQTEFATCWRMIRPEYVGNPGYMPDNEHFYKGIEFDSNHLPIALHYQKVIRAGYTYVLPEWVKVPWWGDDGTPNVILRIGERVPGAIRGTTIFAPLLKYLRQVAQLNDAYIVGKRAQASHPVVKVVDNPGQAAADDARMSRRGDTSGQKSLTIIYTKNKDGVIFPSWQFMGQDFTQFLNAEYRVLTAARGMPWEYVLAQLTDANLAASRAAMLQFYRVGTGWQNEHIQQCTSPMDESYVREGIARGYCNANPAGLRTRLMAANYRRPPQNMPDPGKEAKAGQTWAQMGRDFTGIFGESGLNFEDCVLRRQQDELFAKAHGVRLITDEKVDNNAATDGEGKSAEDQGTKKPATAEDQP